MVCRWGEGLIHGRNQRLRHAQFLVGYFGLGRFFGCRLHLVLIKKRFHENAASGGHKRQQGFLRTQHGFCHRYFTGVKHGAAQQRKRLVATGFGQNMICFVKVNGRDRA